VKDKEPYGKVRLKDGAELTLTAKQEWESSDEDHPGELMQAQALWTNYHYSPSDGIPFRLHVNDVAKALKAKVVSLKEPPEGQDPDSLY
jgi:hypothetical protein